MDGAFDASKTGNDGETTMMLLKPESASDSRPLDDPGFSMRAKSKKHNYLLRCKQFVLLTFVVAPIGGLTWTIVFAINHGSDNMLASSVIGGRLTSIQAKGIDFVCGAFFSPLLMVLFDYLWFTNARSSVLNELQKGKGMPLPTVVEASSTSAGGFNPFKLQALLQGKTWRLLLLSVLVLLSGATGKMFSNLIAYQAYSETVLDSNPATLRLLDDAHINSAGLSQEDYLHELQFSTSQLADISNQMVALFTSLTFESAVGKLSAEGTYIGTNATSASLDALSPNIIGLAHVPAYQLSIDCQPGQPTAFGADQMGETYFTLTAIFDDYLYQAEVPGIMTIGSVTSNNDDYPYAGFDLDHTEVFLGYLSSFNDTTIVFNSSFGSIHPAVFNMTPSGFQETKSIMTTWGIRCSIHRQEGFLNYIRQLGGPWTISDPIFSDEKTTTTSFLRNWQTALNYQSPGATIPGLGPPLATTAGDFMDSPAPSDPLNWTIFALNYLYASGEAQRITYEVAARRNTSTNLSSYLYPVAAKTLTQYYRITYIPLLLVLGFLGVSSASAITSGMVFYTQNTRTAQVGRDVDKLRLVIDCVAGLRDVAAAAAAGALDDDELRRWAEGFRVRYVEVMEAGEVVVRLVREETVEDIGRDE
jgi:hypothetical protein